jgi:DNA modification methylase
MNEEPLTYDQFLQAKTCVSSELGMPCDPDEIHPMLKPHQRDIVRWNVMGGRRADFLAFGLGKTFIQLETVRIILKKKGGIGLIVAPLGVRQEFMRDAATLGISITFVRRTEEIVFDGMYLTNFESVRDGNLDPKVATVVSLDEASILAGFGGSKTFREFMGHFENTGTYRFVATATPSPNEYIELLAYAAFLGVMDVGQAKTRFFKRNSEKADTLTIHPHKEKEFWLWMASWAIFLQKPSDLGYSDEGYELPQISINWHEVDAPEAEPASEKNGQGRLVSGAAVGVVTASREKRRSIDARMAKMLELRAEDPAAHRIIWHDLEDERKSIEKALPDCVTVFGSQDLDAREKYLIDFADGKIQELAGKPSMLGQGCNFQRHCSWAIFLGIGFKFRELIQSIHRVYRFLQTKEVRIDLIYTSAEREVRNQLLRKWGQHKELVEQMSNIIREHGLAAASIQHSLNRTMGVKRVEESGADWRMVNNDCVVETQHMPSDSVKLILTSIPFATQYEYSPSYNDFGHTDDTEHFFRQMDFLSPQLYRILEPGRVMVIHVKDRIMPGGLSGFGFQTVAPFHADCIYHYRKHGFAYLGMKTIVTDVVRENAQTYRLGWTEQCKDGSRMGVGMPEYLLLFRKPPTDRSNGYADVPVVKNKGEYTRARWQFDAHGYMKSSGNRLLNSEDLRGLTHADIFKLFKNHSLTNVYDFEKDVAIAEAVDAKGMLPPSLMLLQPQSWHDDVWTDVTRMRTLNGVQEAKGKEMHLCPMQFDIADRVITQFSNKGDSVFDPFGGLGTVPLRARKLGRFGIGCELSPKYFADACFHLRASEHEQAAPTLFNLEASLEEATA